MDLENKENKEEVKIEENIEEKVENKKHKKVKKIIIITIIVIIVLALACLGYTIYCEKNCDNDLPLVDSYDSFINSKGDEILAPAKPIIYIYPEEETDVSVKLVNEKNILHTYPKYETSWEVEAKPNGDLIDKKTGRSLYALYWEGKNYNTSQDMNEGFVVKGQDTISFLEEKLEILGLNEREANEFIIYWLPQMENNKYNYIRFESIEKINEYMPLEIEPKPDSLIRVLMLFKPLEKEIQVNEQELVTPQRTGYTVVEWGGSKIN